MKSIDITGHTYNGISVIGKSVKRKGEQLWLCTCHCGNEFLAIKKRLRNGSTYHCGCIRKESIFGDLSKSPLLDVWKSMLDKCFNENNPAYSDYGGRGIVVCERWSSDKVEGFKNFLEDMGERSEGLTLDRIDVNGNYEPSNCRWADWSTQAFNRRKQQNSHTVRVGIRYDAKMTNGGLV